MESGIALDMPKEVRFIIDSLNRAGFESFVVGGCVRDRLLGKQPKDWDISTDARPLEVKRLFEKTVDTGMKHGTVTIVLNGTNYEATTFRVDGRYLDHRRPSNIRFTSSMEADLSRRDFTVNAIAYHPEKGFFDPFNGRSDLEKGIIRAVGDPGERFREDALRMLRAVRFSARLGYSIEPDTMRAIRENSSLVVNISIERIRDELTGILTSGDPAKFLLLKESGLMRYALPELEEIFEKAAGPDPEAAASGKVFEAMKRTCPDKIVRWAVLIYHSVNIAYPGTTRTETGASPVPAEIFTKDLLKRLRFDNKAVNLTSRLVKYCGIPLSPDYTKVRKTLREVGKDIFPFLLEVRKASLDDDPGNIAKIMHETSLIYSIYKDIKEKGQCTSLDELALNGRDLTGSGFKPGKEIGTVLERLLDAVIMSPELNRKDKLLEIANTYKSNKLV